MKYYVDLNVINDNATSTTIFKFYYDDSTKKITTKNFSKITSLSRILGPKDEIIGANSKKYYIKTDGINFMKNLKYAFSGSRFRATDIIIDK